MGDVSIGVCCKAGSDRIGYRLRDFDHELPETTMQPIRFVMIGGFLGAGKTTAIGRIAQHFSDQGHKVGVVTNDQAYDLVDTMSLRNQGFRVGEVPGACFCCKFDDLVETVAELKKGEAPDVVIAEPVGSCTDLVATVIEPLRHLHGDQFSISPFVVLLKPEHGKKILSDNSSGGFSPQAAYIFLKQLEEAEVIVLNKCDKLSDADRDELKGLIESRFPGREVILHSSHSGEGFEELISALGRERAATQSFLEIDYDIYAQGEAELGWLNATYVIKQFSGTAPDLGAVASQFVANIVPRLSGKDVEIAHLKVLAEGDGDSAIANAVGSDSGVELSVPSQRVAASVELTINARVAMDPERLVEVARETWDACLDDWQATGERGKEQFFRPGRPTPTHRASASDG